MSKAKPFVHSKQFGGPAKSADALTKAYLRVFSGQDGEMVLADLVATVGYYRRPSYAQWLQDRKSPAGFELHSALSNARAEVVQHIMAFLTLTDDQLIALERAARLEGQ
ncbi:hypothetical protein [Mesorhizobium sp. B2-3-4]|uniref:Bbp19 family protein n=1 Tax=Mesorhizobium sp. B2-3-4 TaxID=2589959 RepID=UPI00112B65EA|nr:hypothetical protein [Mesorhizobium sp. B2-3-4]TPM25707.1 hypothetical protein FJ967_32295 [Mesorhizobium sp. B2-3-4]